MERLDRRWASGRARGALVLALGVICGCHRGEGEEQERDAPVQVSCVAPVREQVDDTVVVRGVVAAPPDRQARVASTVAGRLAQVNVQEGTQVKKNAVIAVVEDPGLAAAMGEADARVQAAEVADRAAQAAAARARRMVDEGIAARRELDDADTRAAAADGELRAARARRALAEAERARARVKTPITGTVVHLMKHAGELVDGTAATAIAEIADPSKLELVGDAPASDLVRLSEGQTAGVRLDALPAQPIAGRVIAVAPGVDPATSVGWVRITLLAPDDAGVHPRLGLAGQAEVKLGARAALTVPESSVRRGEAGKIEVVVCAGDRARAAQVKLGARRGDRVEIAAGIGPGDRVVADHALGLEDGAAIAPAGPR